MLGSLPASPGRGAREARGAEIQPELVATRGGWAWVSGQDAPPEAVPLPVGTSFHCHPTTVLQLDSSLLGSMGVLG